MKGVKWHCHRCLYNIYNLVTGVSRCPKSGATMRPVVTLARRRA